MIRGIAALVVILCALPALARDTGQWASQPEEIRAWFRSVMQPENPAQSCCGEADAFDVEMAGEGPDGSMEVRILAGPDEYLIGAIISVPRSKLQTRYGNPLDKFILFIGSGGRLYCLIPKSGV